MAKALFISNTLPEPDTTAAGVHMVQLLRNFRLADWEVHFASTSTESDHPADLSGLDINLHAIKINDQASEVLFKELQPDVVVFDRFFCEEQFSWQVAEAVPNAVKILNTEDLHSLRKARENNISVNFQSEQIIRTWVESETALREFAAIFRSDLVLLTSMSELNELLQLVKVDISYLYYTPITVKIEEQPPGYGERENIAYMGNGKHQPNIDGMEHLLTKLWPEIKAQLPGVELHIYGAYWSDAIQKRCKRTKGVVFKGWVKDKDYVFRKAKLSLAPMRFGAGLKGKVLDSFSQGCPVVMTPVAADGILGQQLIKLKEYPSGYFQEHDQIRLAIAKNDEEFILDTINLYNNQSAWEESQKQGLKAMESFTPQKSGTGLIERILWISKNLNDHRSSNIFGRILQHQAYSSTKYLSKWIQEKQRNQ